MNRTTPAPFFITGYPRSRTAWLAAWLTTDQSLCLHDGILGCSSLTQYASRLRSARPFNGDSDSGLLWWYPQLRKMFPDSRWVLIERDRDQACDALHVAFPELGTLEVKEQVFRDCEQRIKDLQQVALRVRFEDLDDPSWAAGVWSACLPGLVFDERRWKLFNGLKIEAHHDKYLARGQVIPPIPPPLEELLA